MISMISVCMATYNGEKYIREQIESILSQLGPYDELIISDDASSDDTVNIITDIKDSRIILLNYNRNKNNLLPINLVTTNFENALKHAKGDYIYLSDQDDVWCENKVKIIQAALEKYDYVVSDCYVTDSNLNIISDTRFDGSVTRNKYKALISPTPWQGSCAAFRRKVLEKALPFPKGLQSHDRWLGYIGSFLFESCIVDIPLIYYRRHETNTSTATTKSKASLAYKISTRLFYIANLIRRALS